jgi:hypothetical protein
MLFTLLETAIVNHPIQSLPDAIVAMSGNLEGDFGVTTHVLVIAQFQNVDILSNIQTGWTDFLQTGKAGALVVGLVVGYMIRGITR